VSRPDRRSWRHAVLVCARFADRVALLRDLRGVLAPRRGTLAPSTGIVGSFATLKRSDGATQVTYNGHPLYTYVGDTAPGLANGNRIDLTVVGGTK